MLRRSSRLQSMGYYNSEGNPTISYKEIMFVVFKRRKNHFQRESRVANQNVINNDKYEDTSDNFNGNSNSNSNNCSRWPTMFNQKIFGIFFFMLPLCFRLAYWIPTLSCSFLDLGLPCSSVSPNSMAMELDVKYEDLMKRLRNLEDNIPYHLQELDVKYEDLMKRLRNLENKIFYHLQKLNVKYEDLMKRLRNLEDKLLLLMKQIKQLSPDVDTWPNFALESQGAIVLVQRSSETYRPKEASFTFLGIPISLSVKPKTVIQGWKPLLPGRCWPFPGGRGHLFIALSHPVHISHVTLGHISRNVSTTGSISSAPKMFSVYGLETLDGDGTHLGTFIYDNDGDVLQTFKLHFPSSKEVVIRYVKLQVESNWGHPNYTCLYSFRVHGKLAE